MFKLLVLHGPNLNLLGQRQPDIYGRMTLSQLDQQLLVTAKPHQMECFQSNAEHQLIDRIHQAFADKADGLVINPASLTHSSIGIRDALLASQLPFVEVHLSNIFSREPFRHHSYMSDIAIGVISGFGTASYEAGLKLLIKHLESY